MSKDDFLTRWSRRKQEVAKAEQSGPKAATASDDKAASSDTTEKPQPEFDVSTLPPIESINAASDAVAFLRAGVPPELTRAALRRVWTADPTIRDFIGLAENAWDFTDPNAMPGFGPLEATEEVRRMIARVVGQIGEQAQPRAPDAAPPHAEVAENSNDSNVINMDEAGREPPQTEAPAADQLVENHAQILGNQVMLQSNIEDNAAQHDATKEQEKPKQLPRRGHGGALPR